MTHVLELIGVIVPVGFAAYCMVCERIAANERRRNHTQPAIEPVLTPIAKPRAIPAPFNVGARAISSGSS